MSPDALIAAHSPDWERLAALVKRAQRGQLGELTEVELVEFGRLYRAAASDLAVAQRDFPRHALAAFLNQLVGQAHPIVYRGEPLIGRRLREFYRDRYPQLYRELGPFILAAALLFFGTGILFFLITVANPAAADLVVPASRMADIRNGTPWWKDLKDQSQVGAALIMRNNIGVSLMAFAGGMLLGLGTVYVLVVNGLVLGGVMGLLQVYGHAAPLAEFIIGHGVIELSEITMAGGSGLLLGYALLQPGLLSRREALGVAAQKAVRLLLGSIPLLAIAGAIEGLISPSDAPGALKYTIGISSGVLLYGYLLLGGRGKVGARKDDGGGETAGREQP